MLGWLGHSCCTYWGRTSSPMEGRWCPQGGWPSTMILKMLRGPTKVRLALPTFTLPWTHSAVGLCINWWGLESSLRLVFFSFPFVVPYKHVLPTLAIVFIHASFRLNKTVPRVLANCIHVFVSQIASIFTFIPYKLYLIFLQTVILQTVILRIVFPFFSTRL